MGQTEPGSFVVNLLAPITESPTRAEVKEPQLGAKFKRKVTRMLVSGLSALREATELVNRGNRIREFERRIDEGISANLCEATTNLINAGSGVDVSVSWALAREQDRIERSERTTVKFTPSDGRILEKAARRLRERKESSDERIEGHVSAPRAGTLRTRGTCNDQGEGSREHGSRSRWTSASPSTGKSPMPMREDERCRSKETCVARANAGD